MSQQISPQRSVDTHHRNLHCTSPQLLNSSILHTPLHLVSQLPAELLYVPFVLPFLAMSAITIVLHRRNMHVPWWTPFREAFSRVKGEGGVWWLPACMQACRHTTEIWIPAWNRKHNSHTV